MRSFIISTFVFALATYFLHRYFEENGLDKGRTRTLLVMLLASVAAYSASSLVDWLSASPPVFWGGKGG